MKRLLLLATLALPALAFAQGALTPPGAPAPTMKSLDQLEPRTPLVDGIPGLNREANGGFTIQNPGSYYLTGNLSIAYGDAITINSGNVTLDLNGFTISSRSAATAGSGITTATGTSRITIRNGFIAGGVTSSASGFSGPGLRHGLYATGSNSVVVENVTVEGLVGDGINLLNGSGLIRSCTARLCGGIGLRANQVLDSQARQCGGTAIFAGTAPDAGTPAVPVADGVATNCYGESLTGSPGIFASSATNCFGKSDSGAGISARSATGCDGQSLSGHGVDSTVATGCQGYSYYSTGISAGTATNCYGTSNSGWGLYAQSATNCHGKSEHGTRGLNAANTATGCTGLVVAATTDSTVALFAANAENCRGEVKTGYTSLNPEGSPCTGLEAAVATNCTGIVEAMAEAAPMKYAYGLRATQSAANCSGSAPAGIGLYADDRASNCYGIIPGSAFVPTGTEKDYGLRATNATGCTGRASDGTGLWAETATDCRGLTSRGSTGLWAESTATNCYGSTVSGDQGLWTKGTASFCRGYHGNASGTALHAQIAVACTAEKGVITVEPTGSKQLGTP